MRLLAILALLWVVHAARAQGAVYGGSANGGAGGNAATNGGDTATNGGGSGANGADGSYGGPGGAGGISTTIAYNGCNNNVTVERLACGAGAPAWMALSALGLACVPRVSKTQNHKPKKGGVVCPPENASPC
jgi:hypothetical protein